MPYRYVIVEQKQGGATITLNRPDAMNALTPEFLVELRQAVEEAGRDDRVGVIVLTTAKFLAKAKGQRGAGAGGTAPGPANKNLEGVWR